MSLSNYPAVKPSTFSTEQPAIPAPPKAPDLASEFNRGPLFEHSDKKKALVGRGTVPKRNLDAQLAKFLREQRGEMSYVQFAKKIGIGHMTARPLESGEHISRCGSWKAFSTS